jgi:hypothetical protein
VTRVELAAAAVEDLDKPIVTHSLPSDTRGRVRRSLAPLEEFPGLGPELAGWWTVDRDALRAGSLAVDASGVPIRRITRSSGGGHHPRREILASSDLYALSNPVAAAQRSRGRSPDGRGTGVVRRTAVWDAAPALCGYSR